MMMMMKEKEKEKEKEEEKMIMMMMTKTINVKQKLSRAGNFNICDNFSPMTFEKRSQRQSNKIKPLCFSKQKTEKITLSFELPAISKTRLKAMTMTLPEVGAKLL